MTDVNQHGAGPQEAFSPEDAGHVCDLLRHGATNPDLWTHRERQAVTRLHCFVQVDPQGSMPSDYEACEHGRHRTCIKCIQDGPDESQFMTDDEHAAVQQVACAWAAICKIVGDEPTRSADLSEVVFHVHALQHFVMAQAAARCYPALYRLAGGTV